MVQEYFDIIFGRIKFEKALNVKKEILDVATTLNLEFKQLNGKIKDIVEFDVGKGATII